MGYNKKQRPYRNERNRPRYLSFVSVISGLLLFGVLGGIAYSEPITKQIKNTYKTTGKDFVRPKTPGCIEVGQEFFTPIQNMPRFLGCEDLDISIQEKKKCAEKKMLEFVYGNIQYPARVCNVEGMVVISFTIDEEGNVIDPKIIRDIGGGFGEEGLRIVRSMPQWIPAEQDGKPVKVNFNLPIKFKI